MRPRRSSCCAITYLPLGTDAFDAIDGMFYVDELRNNDVRHAVRVLRGPLRAPAVVGELLVAVEEPRHPGHDRRCCVCLAAAPFLLPRRACSLLGLAIGVPLVFFVVRLNYALPYYYYAWQPQLVLPARSSLAGARLARPALGRVAAAAIACRS